MGRKKHKFTANPNVSTGPNDTFGMIYDGLIQSEQYKRLSLGVRDFYIKCRVQSASKHGRSCLFKHSEETGATYDIDNDFVFPAKHMQMYGIDRSNGQKLMNELISAGFIEIKEKNKHMYKVNVYSFSGRWKNN